MYTSAIVLYLVNVNEQILNSLRSLTVDSVVVQQVVDELSVCEALTLTIDRIVCQSWVRCNILLDVVERVCLRRTTLEVPCCLVVLSTCSNLRTWVMDSSLNWDDECYVLSQLILNNDVTHTCYVLSIIEILRKLLRSNEVELDVVSLAWLRSRPVVSNSTNSLGWISIGSAIENSIELEDSVECGLVEALTVCASPSIELVNLSFHDLRAVNITATPIEAECLLIIGSGLNRLTCPLDAIEANVNNLVVNSILQYNLDNRSLTDSVTVLTVSDSTVSSARREDVVTILVNSNLSVLSLICSVSSLVLVLDVVLNNIVLKLQTIRLVVNKLTICITYIVQ